MNNIWLIAIGTAALALLGALLLLPGGEAGEDAVSFSAETVVEAETTESGAVGEANTDGATAIGTDTDTAEGGPAAIDGVITEGEYAHSVDAGGFQVHWRNDSETLWIAMVSPGTGYAAIGIDPDSRMQGANMIMTAVVDGETVWRDDYGTGALSHTDDVGRGGTDDVIAAAGREHNGYTIVEFAIPLDSGDPYDKPLEPGGTYTILVAYNTGNDRFNVKHTRRGSGEMHLDPAP